MINFKKFAKIPDYNSHQEYKFLVVEHDNASGGFNLYYHINIESSADKNDWFEQYDAIQKFAELEYGIELDSWIDY